MHPSPILRALRSMTQGFRCRATAVALTEAHPGSSLEVSLSRARNSNGAPSLTGASAYGSAGAPAAGAGFVARATRGTTDGSASWRSRHRSPSPGRTVRRSSRPWPRPRGGSARASAAFGSVQPASSSAPGGIEGRFNDLLTRVQLGGAAAGCQARPAPGRAAASHGPESERATHGRARLNALAGALDALTRRVERLEARCGRAGAADG